MQRRDTERNVKLCFHEADADAGGRGCGCERGRGRGSPVSTRRTRTRVGVEAGTGVEPVTITSSAFPFRPHHQNGFPLNITAPYSLLDEEVLILALYYRRRQRRARRHRWWVHDPINRRRKAYNCVRFNKWAHAISLFLSAHIGTYQLETTIQNLASLLCSIPLVCGLFTLQPVNRAAVEARTR